MSRFEDLKRYLCELNCSVGSLEALKTRYSTEVASTRRLESIRRLCDLIVLLEKRDHINEDNVEILEELFLQFRDVIPPQRRNAQVLDPMVQIAPNPVLPEVPNDLYEHIHMIIANQIGHSWPTFARSLGITQGQIDELEDRHRTVSERIRDILVYHFRICPYQHRRSTLFNALCRARRRDLALVVQGLFDNYALRAQ